MSANGEPISKCPVCRYDLTGLPRTHRCPECGFEYDESMRIWWISGPSKGFWIVTILLLVSIFCFFSLAVLGMISLSRRGSFWLSANILGAVISRTILAALAAIVGSLGTQFAFRYWRPFVIVAKDSLQIRYFYWRKKLAWDDIVLAGSELTKLSTEPSSLEAAPPIPKWKRLFIPQCLMDRMNPFQIVVRHRSGSNSVFALPPFVLNASARKELNLAIYRAWSKSRAAMRKPDSGSS